MMPSDTGIKSALGLYDALWTAVIPFLRHHHRLADGYRERTLRSAPGEPVDLWIQSASAGEAYLTTALVEALSGHLPLKILATANTRQGVDILSSLKAARKPKSQEADVWVSFFPFDRPRLMAKVLRQCAPRCLVVLETEIWPGLFYHAKRSAIPIVIINGRITPKSLKAYRHWPGFWRALSPDRILAISREDAARFNRLFPQTRIETMPNIKFDRIETEVRIPAGDLPIRRVVPPDMPLVVMGSVREEEEAAVERVIARLLNHRRDIRIGLFPRHLHRLTAWEDRLKRIGVGWRRRSEETGPAGGGVLLWDTFGELSQAYALAEAAFVGGSLAPLGGQNFLEPLCHGVLPVIGPFWDNFAWVGPTLFDKGLVRTVRNDRELTRTLIEQLEEPAERSSVRADFLACIRPFQGGTRQAAAVIQGYLG